ncbi:hypothetical protein BKA80DRAFT_62684 [Phyllosticta citrichinensis]
MSLLHFLSSCFPAAVNPTSIQEGKKLTKHIHRRGLPGPQLTCTPCSFALHSSFWFLHCASITHEKPVAHLSCACLRGHGCAIRRSSLPAWRFLVLLAGCHGSTVACCRAYFVEQASIRCLVMIHHSEGRGAIACEESPR